MINMFWFKPQPPPKIVNISVEVDVYIYLDSRCLGKGSKKKLKKKLTNVSFAFTHTYTPVKTNIFRFFPQSYMENFEKCAKTQKQKKQYVVPCYLWLLVFSPSFFGNLSHMVQNLYSERELSIKLLLGEKTRKKTNISPFPATHTYIKLTFVSFFFNFFF